MVMLDTKNKKDVLIVDDDKGICEVLKEYCINMGCFKNIVFAHDGLLASQKLRMQKFSLILLDMNMPKKTGYDFLKDFEGNTMNSLDSIVIVSGTLDKELIEMTIEKGVKNFLVKPFTEAQFQEKVLKIMTNQSLAQIAKKK